ncbi:MAG: hypothetical protein H0U64_04225 [Gemmatimonadaceae bacterium]|nr:hypothetical protein [Gemmatimonadaceae bacterium]
MGQFKPADFSRGDPNTIGGYMAVHDRPAAFEGSDGASYSTELVVDKTQDDAAPFGGYILFIRWGQGEPFASGHLETPYLFYANTEEEARSMVSQLPLSSVKKLLDGLIAARAQSSRPWWEVMHEEGPM